MATQGKVDRPAGGARAPKKGLIGSIGIGGGVVILGIILMLALSFWVGLIVVLVGLIAFGGFAKGKWY